MERVRAVMAESGMGHSLWAEAMLTAVFTRNRSPSKDGRATPFERIYNKKPDLSMLRVWGSPVFALKPKKQQRKLEAKVLLGRLVGYGAGGKAYRVYTPQTKNVVVRRDVVVDEGETRAERVKGPLAPGVCMPIPNTEEDTPVVKGEGMAAPKAETPIVTPPTTRRCFRRALPRVLPQARATWDALPTRGSSPPLAGGATPPDLATPRSSLRAETPKPAWRRPVPLRTRASSRLPRRTRRLNPAQTRTSGGPHASGSTSSSGE